MKYFDDEKNKWLGINGFTRRRCKSSQNIKIKAYELEFFWSLLS